MGKIISVINQKGGVGKTTTAFNLGVSLSNQGKKVLLIDLDPQASLTISAGMAPGTLTKTVYDLIMGEVDLHEVKMEYRGLDIVPANVELSAIDVKIAESRDRESLLKAALHPFSDLYDCIIIDCPPNLGILSINALHASQGVIIPMHAEYLALEGLSLLVQTVNIIRERLNPYLKIEGIVMTKYDRRKKINREVYAMTKKYFCNQVLQTVIRNNVDLSEAPGFGMDIFEYNHQCAGASDYKSLCKEIISREVV